MASQSEPPNPLPSNFGIVEATIADHRATLDSGLVTALELTIAYLLRIAHYDIGQGLNAFTLINPDVVSEARASDEYRASGKPARPLEGIPYTLKDSYKYAGLTVTNGSPALEGLMSNEDSFIASRLRAAGAILLGKTNMPPMACGGMQRGLYGRAESPYNSDYLTGAFSSGSSNGAATSTAVSMGVFAMGSETVSSGRSPASNNALVVYTPSKGVLSCRGLWPLYVTCDVPTPMTRTIADMLEVLDVIAERDDEMEGDFWRGQKHLELPIAKEKVRYKDLAEELETENALKGKRIGAPKMYIGEKDGNPNAKATTVNPDVIKLWNRARKDLEALGAEVILTDFPLVTNYEDENICGETNNIVGAPPNWSSAERTMVIAKSWDDFLASNNDEKIKSLKDVDTAMFFPKPEEYIPDTFLEVKNLIDYDNLPALAEKYKDTFVFDLPGMKQAVTALEAQRKRDFEDWLTTQDLDFVVFPAQGDVGKADLEFNMDSAAHALGNGVKYSNGNRAIRHLGVPTVSVPMGVMERNGMPVSLTFAGRGYDDERLLTWAGAFERGSRRREMPKGTPSLETDVLKENRDARESIKGNLVASVKSTKGEDEKIQIQLSVRVKGLSESEEVRLDIYLNGEKLDSFSMVGEKERIVTTNCERREPERLDWSLEPMPPRSVMVLVVARVKDTALDAKLLWTEPA